MTNREMQFQATFGAPPSRSARGSSQARLLLLIAALGALTAAVAPGQEEEPQEEPPTEADSFQQWLLAPKLEFDDWLYEKRPSLNIALDLSTRLVARDTDMSDTDAGFLNWIGLDSSDRIEWDGLPLASILFQAYAMRADGLPGTPIIFDDPHDWELQWRFVYLDFDRFEHEGASFKLGHFQVPFGLEWTSDTTGTLRQYTNAKNLGVKADWGASVHGERDELGYEVSVTRGSGNEYRDEGDNYVLAGRLGYRVTRRLTLGASFFDADLTGQDAPIRPDGTKMPGFPKPDRRRYGVDARWTLPTIELLGEFSAGTNDDQDVWSGLAEINYEASAERFLAYSQVVGAGAKIGSSWEESLLVNLGVRRLIGPNITIGFQWSHDLEAMPGKALGDTGMLQLRYRF